MTTKIIIYCDSCGLQMTPDYGFKAWTEENIFHCVTFQESKNILPGEGVVMEDICGMSCATTRFSQYLSLVTTIPEPPMSEFSKNIIGFFEPVKVEDDDIPF